MLGKSRTSQKMTENDAFLLILRHRVFTKLRQISRMEALFWTAREFSHRLGCQPSFLGFV